MRRNIIDEDGRFFGWFETDKAKEFCEGTFFDGHNHCGNVGRSQWSRESLFLTASGRWVRCVVGGSQSHRDRDCELLTLPQVADWFMANGDEAPEGVSEEVRQIIASKEV